MSWRKMIFNWRWLAVTGLLLAACQSFMAKPNPTAAPIPTMVPSATPVPPTPTPTPRTLVVCLGQEPKTLYPYGGSSRSMWSVLEAVYDGPIDTRGFTPQPVILEKLPSLADGSAVRQAVTVNNGDAVVDVNGEVTALQAGTVVVPSGCSGQNCAVAWDGKSSLQMDQLKLTYQLKAELKWSDGQPLTAEDSVYAYQLSSDAATPVSKRIVDRTVEYKATSATQVEWSGLPGDLPASLDGRFWMPLPKHAWQETKPADLLTADLSAKKPMGWGPYQVQEWVPGDHIQLVKNSWYFRAKEGLPHFDTLVFRFLGEPADNNLAALLTGECDLVDQTSLLEEQLSTVLDLQKSKKLKAYISQGPEWEHLDFGITPASYDDGYAPAAGDRVDFFGDPRMRQAVTYCLDRQQVVDKLLFGLSSVPGGYLPPNHPLFQADLKALPFDPAQGKSLLDQVGWKDLDGDPNTPRVAAGVAGIADGTPLTLKYVTTQAKLRVETGKILAASLKGCGLQVELQDLNPGDLYAPGADGVLFGRKFDLAQFGWEAGGLPNCSLYSSNQIPSAANQWVGVNVTGYSNPDYDSACAAARQELPGTPEYAQQNQAVERLFAQDLPAVPLYFRLRAVVSRPDLCGLEMDPSARSALWNMENLDFGANCPK